MVSPPKDAAECAKWLRAERLRRGDMSGAKLAELTRKAAQADGSQMVITQQSISKFENNERPKRIPEWFRYAVRALEAFDAEAGTVSRLPALPARTAPAANDDDVVEIISLDLSLSMGPGTMIEEFVESEPVRLGYALVRSITRTPTDRLRLVRGIGDSMEPTLRSSDWVMIDINERQLSRINGIYWIDHLGLHGIKRLRAAGRGRIMVGSDNPSVPDFEVLAEDLRIEGRAIWLFGREL